MERWLNRVAVVTGASSGIGVATVKDLLKANLIVVGLARRVERMEEYKKELPAEQQKRFHTVKCDVSVQQSVNEAFDWIVKELGGVDILVNNAGTCSFGQLTTLDVAEMQNTLQVNVMGVIHCTQRAFQSMKERNMDGHVVIVNSTLGHVVPRPFQELPMTNIYGPTKYAMTAATQLYKQEFRGMGTRIKVTSVSPDLTDTDLVPEWFKDDVTPLLKAEDVSNCILFAISTPPHVQIHELSVFPL